MCCDEVLIRKFDVSSALLLYCIKDEGSVDYQWQRVYVIKHAPLISFPWKKKEQMVFFFFSTVSICARTIGNVKQYIVLDVNDLPTSGRSLSMSGSLRI